MKLITSCVYLLLFLLLGFGLYLISLHLFQNDLMFHTDIARDFLLMGDIIQTKDLTLIGPKAGGIPGMFFGPVWLYLNIPFLIVGGGNPLVIGYFWVFLVLLSLFSVFFVAYKIFGKTSAITATVIYTFCCVSFSSGFTQSFGSVLLSPWLIYCIYLYWGKRNVRYLLLALLINGFIYQCQPAAGMITLAVTIPFSLFLIHRRKHYKHLLSYFILLLPFSTFILFDLKHDFLQARAFIAHFTGPGLPASEKLSLTEYIANRIDSYFGTIDFLNKNTNDRNSYFGIINFLKQYSILTRGLFLGLYSYVAYLMIKRKHVVGKRYYILFFTYIFGFMIITCIYRGIIIDYYYWAFLPLSIIAFSGLFHIIPKKIFLGITVVVLSLTILNAIDYRIKWENHFTGVESSSWKLNKEVATFIYNDAQSDFGYYVYSADEFGHPVRYAMEYIQKGATHKGTLCQKEQTLYLVYYRTPSFATTNPVYWKKQRIKIDMAPLFVKKMHDITVEKYQLTPEEINVQADPNLVCDLHFR